MVVLTTNRHTAYLHLLARTGFTFQILNGWDVQQRPLPANVTLVGWDILERKRPPYDVVLGHGLVDLFTLGRHALRRRRPYVQVLHGRLERARGVRRLVKVAIGQGILRHLVHRGRAQAVFISETVRTSWHLRGRVIRPGVPLDEMEAYNGSLPELLIVGNNLLRLHFDREALSRVQEELPLRIVGRNPTILGACPAKSWEELKAIYARHRAFVNLLREPEDGYNLATLESMGTGMPVLSLRHPTSPVAHGLNGFVAEDGEGLARWGSLLLKEWELARTMGARARETVAEQFPMIGFVAAWRGVLEAG